MEKRGNRFMADRLRLKWHQSYGDFVTICTSCTRDEMKTIAKRLSQEMLRGMARRGVYGIQETMREIYHDAVYDDPLGPTTVAVRCEAYKGKYQQRRARKAAQARWQRMKMNG